MQPKDSRISNACEGFLIPSPGLTYEIQAAIVAKKLEKHTKKYNRAPH